MSWFELSVCVPREAVPEVEAALERLGAVAVTLEDEADHAVLEPDLGTTPLWPVVQMRGLFEASVAKTTVFEALQQLPLAANPDLIHWREVGDRDWARAWMDRFEPMRFGRRLWIVPGDMEIPAERENVEIHLDPGLAFGTGTHPTTALCLQWLDAADLAGQRIVDYGCGSGVLGIAAALLGANRVVCVDNDPQALEATAANAQRNAVTNQVRGCFPPDFAESGTDVVLANILAGPLISLAPVLTGCARAGASVILSGLLEEQVEEVAAAYRGVCSVTGIEAQDNWARLDLQKL